MIMIIIIIIYLFILLIFIFISLLNIGVLYEVCLASITGCYMRLFRSGSEGRGQKVGSKCEIYVAL